MGDRMRKTLLVLCGLALLSLGQKNSARAATFTTEYLLEQARGKAPAVTAYLTGKSINGKTNLSGVLAENISLEQEGELKAFEKTGEGIHYVVLVDNSGSVDPDQLKEAKRQLQTLRKNMGEKDELELYTVGRYGSEGSKADVLGRTARGSEKKRIQSDNKKIGKIKFLRSKKSRTVLYRSLREVIEGNRAPAQRTVILLVTDGEDDSTGKNNDAATVRSSVKNAAVPVYGVFLRNKAQKPNRQKMKTTRQILDEANCRGYYADCSSGSKAKVKNAFRDLNKIWKKKTFVATFKAKNNKTVEGGAKLALSVAKGGQNTALNTIVINYTDSEPDNEPPVISDIKKEKSNAISFMITDNTAEVVGAGEVSNYVVKEKSDTGEGKNWPISNVTYNEVDHSVVLTFSDDLYTGDYELICSNIHDDTNEANTIAQSTPFSFEGLNGNAERRKQFLRSYWWILLILLVAVIGLIVIVVIKKKPGKVVEINPDELLKADSKLIRLTITDRAGTIKDVEWNVEGSLFVGRSDICNIYFDDERLSKQHFVIEVTKMACYIEDLESTNGTFVNGVKISSRRMLLDGDIITAGREKFVFHTIQTAVPDAEQ